MPTIRKAARLQGRTLMLRDATVADAAFILALRTDARKSAHLSATSARLADQRDWLARYAAATDEAYFVVESATGAPLGTVRLYDARGTSFCWGSWILKDGAPAAAAIESALMVYAYALGPLGFDAAHFQVRRGNTSVRAFHERFGAVAVAEDDDELHYELGGDAIRAALQRYRRYLPDGAAAVA